MSRASRMPFAATVAAAFLVAPPTDAQHRGGGAARQANVNRGNVNRAQTNIHDTHIDANRNVNVNVNRDVDVHGYGNRYDAWGHPIATAAAVTATAVAVGTMVAALPSGCNALNVGGVGYQHCGATYYQPVYEGTAVQYVVVNPP